MVSVLDYGSACDSAAALNLIYIIKNVFLIIRIAAPIILIVMAMLDVVKMVSSSNPDQISQGGRIVNRFFAATFVFLVALIVDVVLNMLGQTNLSSTQCWNDATKEMVEAKYTAEKNERESKDAAENEELERQRAEAVEKSHSIDIKTNDELSSDIPGYNALSTGAKLIVYAKQFVGNRYEYGGNSLTNGIDCSGFVQQVYLHFGYSLPRTTYEQCERGKVVNGVSNARLGDILCFSDGKSYGHVALYAGRLSGGEGSSSGVANGAIAMVHA